MGNEKKKADQSFCDMQFVRDENGKEVLIKDGRFQVMMEWEKPYMEACIDALEPFGDVLEIGFGFGYSSSHIQTYLPKTHTIIEYHPVIFRKAREWAKSFKNIILVEDTWQEVLDGLGIFDVIFFDDYPLESTSAFDGDSKQVGEWSRFLKEKDAEFQEAKEKTEFLSRVQYSDEDLESFFKLLPTAQTVPIEYLLSFFCELREQNQITEVQQEYLFEKLQKEHNLSEGTISAFCNKRIEKKSPWKEYTDRLIQFFDMCAEKHMRQGSRFSCFISDPISKFQESAFVKSIKTDSRYEYQEQFISIDVPKNCGYYHENRALVVTITKL